MMHPRIFLVITAIAVGASALAQRAPDNVLIFDGYGYNYQPCEPSIAVSPANPRHMVAGSILDLSLIHI